MQSLYKDSSKGFLDGQRLLGLARGVVVFGNLGDDLQQIPESNDFPSVVTAENAYSCIVKINGHLLQATHDDVISLTYNLLPFLKATHEALPPASTTSLLSRAGISRASSNCQAVVTHREDYAVSHCITSEIAYAFHTDQGHVESHARQAGR